MEYYKCLILNLIGIDAELLSGYSDFVLDYLRLSKLSWDSLC